MSASKNTNKGRIRTGFFGGSFNPVHYGHISLAEFILGKNLVDEVWFVVSPANPLKKTADPNDALERFNNLKKALSGHKSCIASDFELSMPLPSYTSDTLKKIKEQYPEREFVLIIGGDNLDVFTKWKDYEYLLENHDIIVYPRPGASNKVPEGWARVTMLDGEMMDVSSTKIRGNRD